ncbi:hypothetical protein [Aeromonas caviae]|uniref:hypothetical protein n=1 Tax=Aeromonas caviae TaxID=648 RepID=UPI0030D8B815
MRYLTPFRKKFFGCLIVLSVIGIWHSYQAGIRDAEITKARLVVVWPGLMDMEKIDRGILIMLARSCKLGQVEPERQAVIECLQSATDADDLILLRSMNREQMIRRFGELLEQQKQQKL